MSNSQKDGGNVRAESDAMRVWVYDGPHASHIETRPKPEPGPDDARIRIAHVGICGSDLHGYTGESGRRVPGMIMGHEASGWIEAVGPSVSGLSVGDAVTFNPALLVEVLTAGDQAPDPEVQVLHHHDPAPASGPYQEGLMDAGELNGLGTVLQGPEGHV